MSCPAHLASPRLALALSVALCATALSGPRLSHASCPTSPADLAPGVLDAATPGPGGVPTFWIDGDGVTDVGDAIALMRHLVGLQDLRWRTETGDCPIQSPGDVAPGLRVEGSEPPTWIARGDELRTIHDVVILLRLAVELDQLDLQVTYYRDAKPLLDAHCVPCHRDGAIGPFALETWEQVEPLVPLVQWAVDTGLMPPWPPDEDCASYQHSRALPEEAKTLLELWFEDGAPRGDPATEPPAVEPPEPVVYDTRVPLSEPYTPNAAVSDDYRCFVLAWPHADERHVTGVRVIPDREAQVHHVIAYAIAPVGVPAVMANDAEEAGPGYTCYGGPDAPDGTANWLGAWVPGSTGGEFVEGTGIRVVPGSALVVQVHYNLDNASPEPDLSVVELRTAATVDRKAAVVLVYDSFFFIPAGDPMSVSDNVFPTVLDAAVRAELGLGVGDPYLVHDVALHMHQLGTRTSLSLLRAGGGTDCLLDIPAWDFHWQDVYRLGQPVEVAPGQDGLALRCEWDNSAENQPWVGGVQQDPVPVRWGEGSRDEMCLGLFYVTAP